MSVVNINAERRNRRSHPDFIGALRSATYSRSALVPETHTSRAFTSARRRTPTIMLVVLTLIWGVSWPAMKIALDEIPPFSMRLATAGLGALALLALLAIQRRAISVANRRAWGHIVVSSFLHITAYSLLSSFAQLSATTSRVTVLVYTMPIWAALMARFVLGERITPIRAVALALCASGLTVLLAPHLAAGIPGGMLLAMGAGVSWAAGTIYLKWARIQGDPLAVTTWQLIAAFIMIAACLPAVEGTPHLWPLHARTLLALVYTGVISVGIAYMLWFDIIRRLPAMTAALGVLSVPPIGVVSSMFVLGERPTLADLVGFVLIITASACALVPAQGPAGK
jgi:drug/metabolite transporter (DMT)-like permease